MLRALIFAAFWALLAVPLSAQQPDSPNSDAETDASPARLTVLVFENGRPVQDLTMRIGERTGRSDQNGAWNAEVAPGQARLTVFDTATALMALPLNLRAGEIVQVIVTLRGEDRRAVVSIESSHSIETDTLQTPIAPVEVEGSGMLIGRVISSEDGTPVTDARVFVSGTPVEARTDDEGRYRVELPAGRYSVSVLHGDFATRTVEGVEVGADTEVERDFELPPAGLELAEFVVVEPFIEGSLSSTIDEQRMTESVVNVIGSEQFSRSGDSDAGSALARVTGLTLVGGEFVYIRGLGERYSSTLLNGSNVPSPDPTRKVVPLNLFPTGVIESIRVQKSYSPDMPADFGGGAIEIRTRGIPEEDFFSFEISTKYREGSTFEDGLGYRGGDRDWLGFDDGTREIPEPLAEAIADGRQLRRRTAFNPDGIAPEQLEEIGESLPAIYDANSRELPPGRGVSIEAGKRLDFGQDWTTGITASVLWDDESSTRDEVRRGFTPRADGSLQPNDDYRIQRSERTINLSGFATAGLEYRDEHALKVTSMILRQTEDEVSIQEGFNLDEDGDIRITELEWEERQLIANQVEGRHRFPALFDAMLEWDFSQSRARRDVPDQRRYRYDPDAVSDFIFSRRSDNFVRRYSLLDDDSIDFGIDATLPFDFGPVRGKLTGGYREVEKDRESSIRRFTFNGTNTLSEEQRRQQSLEDIFTEDNIRPGGVELAESTRDSDNYFASLDTEAWYAALDATFFERIRVSGGVRVEDWVQEVVTFQLFNIEAEPVVADLSDQDLLPVVSLTWLINDRQQLRASYAETIIRPDFKELSPAPFTDPILNREVIGNAELIPSAVEHYDLRWEFYPSADELVSLGVFYKYIESPIEVTVETGVEQRLSFANADEAENFGVEFEARKQLGRIGDWIGTEWLWDRLYVAGNLTWIESEISISDQGILTSSSRPLQGQSPIIANLQFGYDDPDRGLSATILANYVGERIAQVGVLGAPDQYEEPAPEIDFVFQWRFKDRYSLKAKFQNLLNSPFEISQGEEVTQRYRSGRSASLSLGVDF